MTETEIKQFVRDIPKRKRITMKTSWQKIFNFAKYVGGVTMAGQHLSGWLMLHPEETKFSVNVRRVLEQVPPISAAIQKKIENIELDNCTTMHARINDAESPMIIVRGERGELCFTVEGTRAKNAAIDELINKEDIEIEVCYASEIPKLSKDEIELFSGFVIDPADVESIMESREETTEVPAGVVNKSSNGVDHSAVV